MSQWNSGPHPQDPNQAYYAGQPGYPPPQAGGFPPPQGGYPPPGGYPQPGGYPPPGGYPTAPAPGYPGPQPGFQPPPYTAGDPYAATLDEIDFNGGEDPEVKGFAFSDASIRRGFIRKVYSILCLQLSITLAFIAWFLYDKPTRDYVQHAPGLLIGAFVVTIVLILVLACCGEVRRQAPTNFILLFLFTLAESFLLGTISSFYQKEEVLMAVGITAAICFGLTLFAFQTKWDFTMCGGILFSFLWILLIFGLVLIFVRNKTAELAYSCLGAFLFSIYLIYDTQLMIGGEHKYSISPEEYVFAALNLYLDIIQIFLKILEIIGKAKK